ncbi:acyltransferase family protein [Aquimarina algiphila]|uniref:acyltransferase family protein n=1 Tax=Aquimarina algiphila TaxID=2047982 RepID=UPI00232F0EAA|nr:acyltransferase family protein [Aquimarina algiphila]
MAENRYYYIDYLRVIAILMMFIFHTSMIFVKDWDWHIQNTERSNMLLEINYWMSSFRMPLLFFVSGFISNILLERMNWNTFSTQRFYRLIIPTIIWTFILVAPQLYFQRKFEGIEQSYIEFYKTFLKFDWYPEGNFHWLHLWFIPYLFCYNLLSIPLFYVLKKHTCFTKNLKSCFSKITSLFIFVFIAILPYSYLSLHYNASYDFVNDIGRHSFFIFFIIAGLLFYRFPKTLELIQTNRKLFLSLSFLSIITINIIRWNQWEPHLIWENWNEKPQTYLFNALLNFNTWMWVFSCLGYARKYLKKGSKLLTYANNAVYPFYILHQTVIVIIGYYVLGTKDAITLKFCFLLLVCFWVCILIYHLYIKPYNIMRFLFGMKKLK